MNGPYHKRQQERDDQEWFRSDEDYPFSFVWVCENLKLDPARVRFKLGEIKPLQLTEGYRKGPKIGDEGALLVLALYHGEGLTRKQIASRLKVSRQAVSNIISGRSYKWAIGIPEKE